MAFLKREHMTTLTGLQLEIARLKRRCHELNCELDARFPQRTAAEECELAVRRRTCEGLLEEQDGAVAGVRAELRARQVRAWALGRGLRADERRFLEELKRRSHRITAMGRELHRQTLTSATLGRQLHRARLRLHRRSPGEEGGEGAGGVRQDPPWREELRECGGGEEVEDDEEEDDKEDDGGEEASDPLPDELCGGRGGGVREQRVRACVPCERVTRPQRPHPMPDPALFLVPLRYRLLRWKRTMRARAEGPGPQDGWEDVGEDGGEEGGARRRVDMGAAEGETAL
ncbi:hypothetical protein NHX12_010682 [Muraenolepis orangiensis]|uniref:CCDC92/74 N-terminal domain-containing protein n=1 Tax=Muraenolepis orangiensis TaxID=630683 RepID=A0A9Q0IAP5_9TELE|nr:hypothetical protein NHX12_010682 [Muraenolepis orangiensis]